MNVFSSLKFFYATCHFCGNKGLSISATNNNGEIAACDECAKRLIVGVSTALAELDRMNAARAAELKEAEVAAQQGEAVVDDTNIEVKEPSQEEKA